MDQFEARRKKLEAGKEKLAAFQKKKKSKSKTTVSNNDGRDECGHENGDELSPPEVSSPSAFSVTDSDQFSFTSGDEWSAEELDQKSHVYYQTNFADVQQESADSPEASWDPVIPLSKAAKQINISDIESALAKRDELINKLTQSLQSSLGHNIPNDDVMSQVHTLAEHILTLQNQLQQADQSLQEQLELHESSALALQAAKEQMLQLQVIINYKDTELIRMFKMFENNTQIIHSLEMKETQTERSLQEVHIMCEQYIDRIKTLEGELHKKMLDAETFTSSQQEWIAREHELSSLLSAKSEEVDALLVSQRMLTYGEQTQERQTNTADQELLKVLECQLDILRREHESDTNEIAMLRKRNTELEAEKSGYTKHLSTCESLSNEYETLLSQHSQSHSQIEYLTSLNSDLQDKLSILSSVEKDFAVLSSEYKKLHVSYQEEVQQRSQHRESDAELSATFSTEKETLNTKITELQNEIANLRRTSKSFDDDDVDFQHRESESCLQLNAQYSVENEMLNTKIVELQAEIARLQTASKSSDDDVGRGHSLVAQLQQELQQKDNYLKEKLYEIAEMQVMLHGLRCSYESVENTLVSNEEVIASLTERLHESEHTRKAIDLDEAVSQKLKLEHTISDLQLRVQEKELECRQYTENIVKLQDELLSAQHADSMEMSEKEHQIESIEEHMAVLNSERAKLVERVKDLEHRLKMECQQYMEVLQRVVTEKEMECKQYTENIVTLQDELLSVQHAHGVEMSEKKYQFERIEEQMEILGSERENLAQKVKDLELTLNLAYQQSQEDLKHVNNEKDVQCKNYAENMVILQDELISTQHIHDLQMSEHKSHSEQTEKQMEILEEQIATLSEKLSVLEQELSFETELRKEMQEKKTEIESQLQVVIADRESLLKTVESLTTEVQFLKKDLQATHVEYKLKYDSHDWNLTHCISSDEMNIIGDVEAKREKLTITNLHSNTQETHDIPYSESINEVEEFDKVHSQVQDIITRLERQQKLAIHHQVETEQLKVKISMINMNEELRQSQAALQAIATELIKAQSEFTNHIASFLKKTKHFEMHEQETIYLQKELLEMKIVQKHMSEREASQEALQAQLENTISQWQRLQFIVQEKEIELHKLQESLDEQKRIYSSMVRTHEEQRFMLQAEIDFLKSAPRQNYLNVMHVDNELCDSQASLENKSHETNNCVHENEVAIINLHDCLLQKETEISDLNTLLSLKESENSQQENSLNVLQKIIADLKISLSESQSQVAYMEEKLKHRESEVEILKAGLYGSIEEKDLELTNFRMNADSQVRDLMVIITERESEINSLRLDNTGKVMEISDLKNCVENMASEIAVTKEYLADRDSELNSLTSSLVNRDSEMYSLKCSHADHEAEVYRLKNIVADKELEITELKNSFVDKESHIVILRSNLTDLEMKKNDLQNTLSNSESEINDLKCSLTAKASEMDVLKDGLASKEFEIDALRKSLIDNGSEIDVLKCSLAYMESEIDVAKSNKDAEIDGLNESLKNKEKEISVLTGSLANVESEINVLKSSILSRESELDLQMSCLTSRESGIDVLNSNLINKESEIDDLKCSLINKVSEIEILKSNNILKESEIEALKNNLINRESEIESLKSNLTNRESEIELLKSNLTNRESEIELLKSNLTNKESEIESLKSNLTNRESEIETFNSSIMNKESEIESLRSNLTNRESEIETLKSNLTNRESEIESLGRNRELEIDALRRSLTNSESEMDELKSSLTNKDSEIETLKSNLSNKESEIETLKSNLSNKESEIDVLGASLADREAEIISVNSSFAGIQSEIKLWKRYLVDKDSEVTALKNNDAEVNYLKRSDIGSEVDFHVWRRSLSSNEPEMTAPNDIPPNEETEINLLKGSLTDNKSEIDTLRICHVGWESEVDYLKRNDAENKTDMTALSHNLPEKELEINALKTTLSSKQHEMNMLENENADMKSKIELLASELSSRASELEDVIMSLKEKELEIHDLRESLVGIEITLQSLKQVNEEKDSELEMQKNHIKEMEIETSSLRSECAKNESEINNMKDSFVEKESEIDHLKMIIAHKDEEIRFEKNIFSEKNLENDDLRLELSHAQTVVSGLESDLTFKDTEREMLVINLAGRDSEMDSLRSNLTVNELKMNNIMKNIQEKESEIVNLLSRVEERETDFRRISSILAATDLELTDTKANLAIRESELVETKYLLAELGLERHSLQSSLAEKEAEVHELQIRISEKESEVVYFKNSFTNKDSEISDVKSSFEEKESEVNDLKSKVNETLSEMEKLQRKLNEREEELSQAVQSKIDIHAELDKIKLQLEEGNDVKRDFTEKKAEMNTLKERLIESECQVGILQATLRKTEEEVVAVKNSVIQKESEISDFTDKLSEAVSKLDVLHTTLTNKDEELTAVRESTAEKESEITILGEGPLEANSHVDRLNAILANTNKQFAAIKSCVLEKEAEISTLTQKLNDACKEKLEMSSVIEELNMANCFNEELLVVKNTLEEKDLEICNLTENLKEASSQVDLLCTSLNNANDELRDVKNCVVEKESEICSLTEKLSSVTCQVESVLASLNSTCEELTTVRGSVVGKDDKICALTEELNNANSQVETLNAVLIRTNEDLTAVKSSVVEKESEICTWTERFSEVSCQIISLNAILGDRANEQMTMKDCVVEKESEISELSQKFSEASHQMDTLHTAFNNTNEELKAVRTSLMEKESDYSMLKHKLNELFSQNETLQSELNERKELLLSTTQEKNVLQTQVLTLQKQLETLEVNLHVIRVENSDMKHSLHNNQEQDEFMQSTIIQKESELSNLTIHVADLEQEIEKLSKDLEITKTTNEQLKMEFESKENKFDLTREKDLQDLENMSKSVAEKESTIAELMQSIVDITTIKQQLLKDISGTEQSSHILEVSLSNLMQEVQEKCDTIVHQELQLQEQAEKLSVLMDTLNTNVIELEEIRELNKSLHELIEELTSKSHVHLDESAHQREIIEQQVREMEDLLAQKESEISLIMQSLANERTSKDQLAGQFLAVETNYKSLLGFSSYLEEEILVKETTLFDQKVHIDDQSLRLNDLSQELAQSTLSLKDVNDLNVSLKSQIDELQASKCDLEQRISKLQNELDNQEITTTQFMVEGKHLNEKLTLLTHDIETKESTIFDLRHDCDMYLKEINDLKQELEQKDLLSISLKEEVESVHASMERSKEEKEMLKANFDSCMEEMQQRFGDQEIEIKRLRSQLAEETKNVNQDQSQMKEIYEHQIGQMEEKLLYCEKQCERLDKELAEVKAKSATAKEVYEHQLSEQELHLQSTNSELVRLKDHLSKITNNHKCEVAGLKRLHEIQTNELEETCVTLERTVAEQKRYINEHTVKFNREKNDLEQSYEIQLSDVEEKRRLCEMEICRLKKHLDEMNLDHEKDMQSLEKTCEARLYELEDKYCSSTNELERLRKSLMCTTGSYSEERQGLEIRVEELETLRRDLQNRNAALEDEIVMIKDQVLHREDEMRAVLKNAAEKQQEMTAEMMSEISHLQQQLFICSQEHPETIAEIKREYETRVLDLQSRNRQLEEKNSSLELIIEEDLSHQKDQTTKHGNENKRRKTEIANMQRQITMLTHENTALKNRLSAQKSPERSLGLTPDEETICPPYSHSASFSDKHHSQDGSFGDCFSPADNDGPIIEGFVAEPTVSFSKQRTTSHPKPLNIYTTSAQKPDFVEEQCDEFQPEITVDGTGKDSDHPIHEVGIREGFEPETPDRFLIESADESGNAMIWQHEPSVGRSPSHLQAQVNFDFRIPDQSHRDEEFPGGDRQSREELPTDFNSNCTREVRSGPGHKPEKSNDRFEKHLNHIKEELEEEYVTKMRQQQLKLTIEFETKQTEYKTEMEQHFAQRMKAVKYEWERKFNKALLKVKKEMEKRHMNELKQLNPDSYPMQQHQNLVSPVEDKEQDLITEGSEKLSEAVDHPLRENHEFAETSDAYLGQAEISQTSDLHSQVQHDLQVMLTNRVRVSSASLTATTLTLNASSAAIDRENEIDEADSSRSEVSETSSAKERFLEELEDITHQSCQDLPLEWELTSTVIESGNFEQEPEHHSVWEVFDGRCVRHDCQEVRHKFHKLYQWVVKHKGDGFGVVLDGELKMLMVGADLPKDYNDLFKLSQANHSEIINSVHSSDGVGSLGEISRADLLARVLSLESDRHKLEEKLLVQIHCNSNIRRELQQYEAMYGHLHSEFNARLNPEGEILKLNDIPNKTILLKRSCSSGELKEGGSCAEVGIAHKNLTCQRNDSVSETVETVGGLGLPHSQEEHVLNSLDMSMTINNLHMMLIEKEDQVMLLQQENDNLKSYIDKFVIEATLPALDTERPGVEQQQLKMKQQLLDMKDILIRNLPADLTSPQTTSLLTDGSGDCTNQDDILDLKSNINLEHLNTMDQSYNEHFNNTSTTIFEENGNVHGSSPKHSNHRCSDESRKKGSGVEMSGFSSSHSPFTDISLKNEYESAASFRSNTCLRTSSFDGSHNVISRSQTPELEDKELAEEISRLQKDIQETKAIYCKENFLLHEAWNKETALKNRIVHRQISDKEIAAQTDADDSAPSLPETDDDIEMLKQKLDICLNQNQMLEDENAILRKRVREQAAKIIILKKNTLLNKNLETEEWRQSFSNQLTAIHKQRNDLIQLLSDMDSGKESTISESLQGSLQKESLKQVQEDLVVRIEELDHLYKMLTQRQVELQHCEAERRHLEQLCLLKDETEMQLMKQKRLMEEQLSEIEFHLRERETILIEEKTQLLQELKDGKFHQSRVSMLQHSSAETPSSELFTQSSLDGSNLRLLESAASLQHHSLSADVNNQGAARNVDHQHLQAIERLRTKLKQEYEAHTARISDSQSSPSTSYNEGHNKQV